MTNLKTTTELVKYLLERFPNTRNSDNRLYIKVLQYKGAENGINIEDMSVLSFFMKINELDIPSIETVGRCRRKIVEQFPELAGDSNVEAGRMLKEEEYKRYAGMYIDRSRR